MKTYRFFQNFKKTVAFSFAATFAVSFTACSDNLTADNDQPANSPEAPGELLEPYGLTYQDFISSSDVIIMNADTTEISVSKALADKLGITSFVNHPMGIWHKIEQLPYARKATAEKLVDDRYILTVEPASVAELIGEKEVQLNTDLYVNNNLQKGTVTCAGGIDMPDYAAKYVDADHVVHPAVIHMTDPLGYDSYHDPDQQTSVTRGASEDGSYDYITPEKMAVTRASVHKRILAFDQEISFSKKFACGSENKDTIDFDLKVPIDFELNYFLTLNGGVKWNLCVPVPCVKKFEAGLDGKFAFSPELTVGFSKELKLDEDKFTKTLMTFPGYSFTFWVGCVPVVVKCQPNLYTKLDGKVTGKASVGFKYEYENNFKCGVCYENGNGWSIIKEFDEVKNDFTFIRPQVKVKAEAGIGLYLGMDVMIGDVVGPAVSVGPRLGTEAELTVSPLDKNWNEKNCFNAKTTLTVNAEAGAKLKVLGYELAEYKAKFPIAGPWTLWKYPSDGTEHKVGDLDFCREDYTNFDILINGMMNSREGISYVAFKKDAVKELCEMYNIDSKAAENIIKRAVMTKIIKRWGRILTSSSIYPQIVNMMAECSGEVALKYDEYLEQKAAEEGDMEYVNAKNWERLMESLRTNDDVMRVLYKYKSAPDLVHTWFTEDFGREPNVSSEDLAWLADHLVNFEQYANERYSKDDDDDEVYYEGWDAVKSKLMSLYPDLFANSPKPCSGAFNYVRTWFADYYPGDKVSTNPYYFDQINEKFVEYLRNNKGMDVDIRKLSSPQNSFNNLLSPLNKKVF